MQVQLRKSSDIHKLPVSQSIAKLIFRILKLKCVTYRLCSKKTKTATYRMYDQEPYYHTSPTLGKNFDATPALFYSIFYMYLNQGLPTGSLHLSQAVST
jgi:hypothetical protein